MAARNYHQFDKEVNPANVSIDSELPPPPKKFFDVEEFKVYFEVDTDIVKNRLKKTIWPFNRQKFFEEKPDLYGAMWVPTTLIFIMSLAGSLAQKLSSEGYSYNPSSIVKVSFVIYLFEFSIPALLSFLLLDTNKVTYAGITSLYGYSYFMFMPATVISVIRVSTLSWLSFLAASVWASSLVTKNIYSDIPGNQNWKKYLIVGIASSGYFCLTVVANKCLFN
jgi:hypothetical protein